MKRKNNSKVPHEKICNMRADVTSFLTKKELPISLASDLITFIQNMTQKYKMEEILKLTMSNKTSTQILNQMVQYYKDKLFYDLKSSPFALSFDESTDIYGPCYLCTNVRYIKEGQIFNKVLALTELGEEITGEKLFSVVHELVFPPDKHDLLKTNLIGVCTDRGSNMLSLKNKGLANRLKEKYPQTFIAYDFCHMFHLIVEASLIKFPIETLNLVKNLCGHFSRSALRRAKLTQVQKRVSSSDPMEIRSMLKYVENRWTSLMNAIDRIRSLWDCLEIYFNEEPEEKINKSLTEGNYCYLELLSCLLKRLNKMITYFEGDDQDYSSIMPKLKETFILKGMLVLKEEIIEKTSQTAMFQSIINLPYNNRDQLKKYVKTEEDFEESFLSKYTEFKLSLLLKSNEYKVKFLGVARNFLLESLIQMYNKIPFNNDLLLNCEVLQLFTFEKEKWIGLFKHFRQFSHINNSDLEHELDLLLIRFESLKSEKSYD